jgi:hypothetical protein
VLAKLLQSKSIENGQWKCINDSPHLLLAIEDLTDSAMPTYAQNNETDQTKQKEVSKELEAFLSSVDHLANHTTQEDEEYESDGGTRYVKDFRTGNWIHEALAPVCEEASQ